MKLTKKTQQVLDEMKAALDRGWVAVDGDAVRFTYTKQTPDHERNSTRFGAWTPETYEHHIWVRLFVGHDGRGKAMVNEARCPWLDRQDRDVPLYKAIEVLRQHGKHSVKTYEGPAEFVDSEGERFPAQADLWFEDDGVGNDSLTGQLLDWAGTLTIDREVTVLMRGMHSATKVAVPGVGEVDCYVQQVTLTADEVKLNLLGPPTGDLLSEKLFVALQASTPIGIASETSEAEDGQASDTNGPAS